MNYKYNFESSNNTFYVSSTFAKPVIKNHLQTVLSHAQVLPPEVVESLTVEDEEKVNERLRLRLELAKLRNDVKVTPKLALGSFLLSLATTVISVFGFFHPLSKPETYILIKDENTIEVDPNRQYKSYLLDPPYAKTLFKKVNLKYPELQKTWRDAYSSLQEGKDPLAVRIELMKDFSSFPSRNVNGKNKFTDPLIEAMANYIAKDPVIVSGVELNYVDFDNIKISPIYK